MGGSCFEQLGDRPSPSDREFPALDNFYPVQSDGGAGGVGGGTDLFEADGNGWPTTEHYFQAAKHPQNKALQEQIRLARCCTGPGSCYELGNTCKMLRKDWEAVKVDVMYAANLAKFRQNAGLRDLLVNTRGRIRAKGAQDMWATWNAILLERIREELRDEATRDNAVLTERVAMMESYRSAAQDIPGERAERVVTAITRQAANRELVCAPQSLPPITIAGCNLDDAAWINGDYWLDPLQPTVNGQPHYMTSDETDGRSGHLFVGRKSGQSKWVLDEELDSNETGGTLTLPTTPSEVTTPPLGDRSWEIYGGAKVRLRISIKGTR